MSPGPVLRPALTELKQMTRPTSSADSRTLAAAERDQFHHALEIVVLDRPNLIGGELAQGPVR